MESVHCNSLINHDYSFNHRLRRINRGVLDPKNARLLSSVSQRGKRFSTTRNCKFSVNAAVTDIGSRNSTDDAVMTTGISGVERGVRVGKSSSALEQLDIERGVCVPFRKYSPETVRSKVLESRGSVVSLVSRGVEIVWTLGSMEAERIEGQILFGTIHSSGKINYRRVIYMAGGTDIIKLAQK